MAPSSDLPPDGAKSKVWKRIAIAGVGLLGGSLGMRLRRDHLCEEVIGIGRDSTRLQHAIKLGAIDRSVTFDQLGELRDKKITFDVVVVCTPVKEVVATAKLFRDLVDSRSVITDVGSTKAAIVRDATIEFGSQFVGSHPLAGSERSGVDAATSTLFDQRLVVVTPCKVSDKSPLYDETTYNENAEKIARLWKSVGAVVLEIDPQEHDKIVASTSHLPHLLASMLAQATPREWLQISGAGWADTTRIASGSPLVWRQILEENRAPVLRALENFATILQTWSDAIKAEDYEQVEQLLQLGKNIRDALGNRHSSG